MNDTTQYNRYYASFILEISMIKQTAISVENITNMIITYCKNKGVYLLEQTKINNIPWYKQIAISIHCMTVIYK